MSAQEPQRRRRRIAIGLGLLLVLLGSAGAVFALTREGEVSNPDVEFSDEPAATPAPEEEPAQPDRRGRRADPSDRFIWAHYGYTRDRRRFLPAPRVLRPPFWEPWQYQGAVLLEFPPVIGGRWLYLLNNAAILRSIDKRTGKVRWRRRLGHLAAASPAYAPGSVYVVILERARRGRGSRAGRVVAINAKTGRIRWSRDLASRTESSPLIVGDTLYFGSEKGTVYAMNARNGNVRWSFRASGAVKGGLALSGGRLYFGDYGGHVYAVWAGSGEESWRASTRGGKLGLGAGNFYSTPAVAFGRVYIGNTDGRVYSFAARSGKLAWRRSTGGYVYASPAVAELAGSPPMVYAGSYSGRFYAFDARSGRVRWMRGGNGRISGGATVIGDIVYYADLGRKKTIGLGARTGRKVFEFERGSYNPVVSDGRTIYLTGYHALYALRPLSQKAKDERAAREAKAAKRRIAKRKAKRKACVRRARKHHDKRGAIARSYRRCVIRNHAQKR